MGLIIKIQETLLPHCFLTSRSLPFTGLCAVAVSTFWLVAIFTFQVVSLALPAMSRPLSWIGMLYYNICPLTPLAS